MRVLVITLFFTLFSSLTFADDNEWLSSAFNSDEDCVHCGNEVTGSPYSQVSEATADIQAAIEASKRRVDLMKSDITWGTFGIGVGKADVYLTESEGKIVDLNVYAKVGVLGINETIKQKVTIDQLMAGQPLQFEMRGGNQPTLIIDPEADFDENGGWATLKIWNGSSYDTEKIAMFRDNGKWKAYSGTRTPSKVIKGLDIRMSGMSVASMHVSRYKIKH